MDTVKLIIRQEIAQLESAGDFGRVIKLEMLLLANDGTIKGSKLLERRQMILEEINLEKAA